MDGEKKKGGINLSKKKREGGGGKRVEGGDVRGQGGLEGEGIRMVGEPRESFLVST